MAAPEEIVAEIQPMFSADAIRHGDLLFVSGCVPMDTEGNMVGEGDLEAQTRKVMENMATVLGAGGTDFPNVLKTTVYMTDITREKSPTPSAASTSASARRRARSWR